jgi:lipopolysaccharide transport system ATP-binding protein
MGMSEPIIRVEGLGKKYLLSGQPGGKERYRSLRDTLMNGMRAAGRRLRRPFGIGRRRERDEFWALRDVSFEVKQGEVVGIIGRNGAGKSTLLKILSRITEPTTGEITLCGRVASLLEVGTGFHPELTGRENVFLNGAILGMSRAEIRKKFDEIVAFAEVEQFLDTPVKRYSSGMYMRLAFAVAAHLEPEILVVDEVLAVGDASFQKKCLQKMGDVARDGRTVLFVSHNMAAVRSLCTRVYLLRQGRLVFDGQIERGLSIYAFGDEDDKADRWRRASITKGGPLYFSEAVARIEGDQPAVRLVLDLRVRGRSQIPALFAFDILDEFGVVIMQALPTLAGISTAVQDEHAIRVTVDLPPLIPGRYSASLWVGRHNTETYDVVESAVAFEINDSPIPGRTFPHSRNHGWLVPHSNLQLV